MTRPTDAAIARAVLELGDSWSYGDAGDKLFSDDCRNWRSAILKRANQFDAESPADMHTIPEKVTTSPERVQIPAESEHIAPYDLCPKCTAHMPVGKVCGGVNCGLRGK